MNYTEKNMQFMSIRANLAIWIQPYVGYQYGSKIFNSTNSVALF